MISNKNSQGLGDTLSSPAQDNYAKNTGNSIQVCPEVETNTTFSFKEISTPQNEQITCETTQCPAHPDEQLQFYCFTNGSIACAECVVSGKYSGTEIANIKKAAEKIREKLISVQEQVATKSQVSSRLEEEVKATEAAINTAIDHYKNDIKSKMEAFRQEINKREKDLLQKLDKIREERLKSIGGNTISSQTINDDIKVIEVMLAQHSTKANDLNLCLYYSKKASELVNSLEDKKENVNKKTTKMLDNFNSQDNLNMTKLKDDYEKIVKSLQTFGENVIKVQTSINIELFDRPEQFLQSTKSKQKSISYSENTYKEPPQKIDLLRKYSSKKEEPTNPGRDLLLKIKKTSSFLPDGGSTDRDSSCRSKNDPKSILYTENDKDKFNIFTSARNKTPQSTSSKRIDLIGAYKDQINKFSFSKDLGSSARALKTEGDEDISTAYRPDRQTAKKLVDTLLSSQPSKQARAVHFNYNTFLDVKTPGNAVSNLLASTRPDLNQSGKANRRENYFSGADLDRIFSDTKLPPSRERADHKSPNQLKNRMIGFNFKNL